MNYPWLQNLLAGLKQFGTKVPHALLIEAGEGLASDELVVTIVQNLLCDQSSDNAEACGNCRQCQLALAGQHPDIHVLTTETWATQNDASVLAGYAVRYFPDRWQATKPKQVISVDAVRKLIQQFSLVPHTARKKIAVLYLAETMNANASNALLKLLEEPTGDAHLVLVSRQPRRLSATIRSRCVSMAVEKPQHTQSQDWLAQWFDRDASGAALVETLGAPMLAKSHLEQNKALVIRPLWLSFQCVLCGKTDVFDGTQQWLKSGLSLSEMLNWLQRFSHQVSASSCQIQSRDDIAVWLSKQGPASAALSAQQYAQFYDALVDLRHKDLNVLNAQLVLEQLMIKLVSLKYGH